MALFKKDERIIKLEELQNVQFQIEKLRVYVDIPVFKNYYTSTTTFPGDSCEGAIAFMSEVMRGKQSPHIYSNKGSCSYSESGIFWRALEKYSHEMAEYCLNREENLKILNHLELREKELKSSLGIV